MSRMHQIPLRVYLAANLLPGQTHPFRGVINFPRITVCGVAQSLCLRHRAVQSRSTVGYRSIEVFVIEVQTPSSCRVGRKRMVRSVDAALSKSGTPCGALYGDTSTIRGQQQQFDTSTTVHGACEKVYRRMFRLRSAVEDHNNIRALRRFFFFTALSTYALSPTLVWLCESGWSDLSCRNQFLIPKIR